MATQGQFAESVYLSACLHGGFVCVCCSQWLRTLNGIRDNKEKGEESSAKLYFCKKKKFGLKLML